MPFRASNDKFKPVRINLRSLSRDTGKAHVAGADKILRAHLQMESKSSNGSIVTAGERVTDRCRVRAKNK